MISGETPLVRVTNRHSGIGHPEQAALAFVSIGYCAAEQVREGGAARGGFMADGFWRSRGSAACQYELHFLPGKTVDDGRMMVLDVIFWRFAVVFDALAASEVIGAPSA